MVPEQTDCECHLYFFCLCVFRHHGSLSTCYCLRPPPLTSCSSLPPSCLFLHLSLCRLPSFHRRTASSLPPPTTWQERKGRPNEAPWTSSAWRASSREERVVCWWSTAGRFLNTTPRTCKAPSTSAAPNWWRGACSRTRCRSLSCCSPTARSRWDVIRMLASGLWCTETEQLAVPVYRTRLSWLYTQGCRFIRLWIISAHVTLFI